MTSRDQQNQQIIAFEYELRSKYFILILENDIRNMQDGTRYGKQPANEAHDLPHLQNTCLNIPTTKFNTTF